MKSPYTHSLGYLVTGDRYYEAPVALVTVTYISAVMAVTGVTLVTVVTAVIV